MPLSGIWPGTRGIGDSGGWSGFTGISGRISVGGNSIEYEIPSILVLGDSESVIQRP